MTANAPLPRTEENETEPHLTLRAFLRQLEGHVAAAPAAWITAEVISAGRKGGAFRLELSEADAEGRLVAKVSASLWRSVETVLAKFRAVTGDDPRPGMQLLLHVQPTFHSAFGLSLSVNRIDPRYTLGEIERRLQEARRALRESGLFDRNRLHACPADYHHIAVVSPPDAASLGDFRETADRLENAGLCRFVYKPAPFQGTQVIPGIRTAMREVYQLHHVTPFCAVCIIRGGGSPVDLAELNQLRIASAVCYAPFPVLTGIGHERDHGLLDDVACRKFDTPSKVALHVEQAIRDSARTAAADWVTVRSESRAVLDSARRQIEGLRGMVATGGTAAIHNAALLLARDLHEFRHAAGAAIVGARAEREGAFLEVQRQTARTVSDARRAITADMETVLGMGPANTLARGFAVVRNSRGEVLPDREAARNAGAMTLQFRDGTVPVLRSADGG